MSQNKSHQKTFVYSFKEHREVLILNFARVLRKFNKGWTAERIEQMDKEGKFADQYGILDRFFTTLMEEIRTLGKKWTQPSEANDSCVASLIISMVRAGYLNSKDASKPIIQNMLYQGIIDEQHAALRQLMAGEWEIWDVSEMRRDVFLLVSLGDYRVHQWEAMVNAIPDITWSKGVYTHHLPSNSIDGPIDAEHKQYTDLVTLVENLIERGES